MGATPYLSAINIIHHVGINIMVILDNRDLFVVGRYFNFRIILK